MVFLRLRPLVRQRLRVSDPRRCGGAEHPGGAGRSQATQRGGSQRIATGLGDGLLVDFMMDLYGI